MLTNRMRMGNRAAPFTQIFTSSQSWTVPNGVDAVDVTVVGAGGGSGRTTIWGWQGLGGAGGGYVNNQYNVPITSSTINIVIGAGVLRGTGGQSSFGTTIANGGQGGYNYDGMNGGSGGGAAGDYYAEGLPQGAAGGSNGSNGSTASHYTGGTGQGTTTYGVNGILYAGGGGGGDAQDAPFGYGGVGGAGGGGKGGGEPSPGVFDWPQNGTANTGGGGGGCVGDEGGSGTPDPLGSTTGGSGIVIVKFNG